MSKQYDQHYFDFWYRGGQPRPGRRETLARKVHLAVAMAEYYLGRRLTSVLDVGCGEGAWRAPLRALRPGIEYLGLDSSEYAVGRYGRGRNLRLLRFGQLAELRFDRKYDLLVCSDLMHYLPAGELKRGLSGFAEICAGFAFIDLFCRGDDFEGDTEGYLARPASWYRRVFAEAGWLAVGSHGYLGPQLSSLVSGLERTPN